MPNEDAQVKESTPDHPDKCPFCGAEFKNSNADGRTIYYHCITFIYTPNQYWSRTPDCYERQLTAVEAERDALAKRISEFIKVVESNVHRIRTAIIEAATANVEESVW